MSRILGVGAGHNSSCSRILTYVCSWFIETEWRLSGGGDGETEVLTLRSDWEPEPVSRIFRWERSWRTGKHITSRPILQEVKGESASHFYLSCRYPGVVEGDYQLAWVSVASLSFRKCNPIWTDSAWESVQELNRTWTPQFRAGIFPTLCKSTSVREMVTSEVRQPSRSAASLWSRWESRRRGSKKCGSQKWRPDSLSSSLQGLPTFPTSRNKLCSISWPLFCWRGVRKVVDCGRHDKSIFLFDARRPWLPISKGHCRGWFLKATVWKV